MTEKCIEEKIAWFKCVCRDAGLKVTPQRVEIYRLLLQCSDHPSAEVVHRRIKEKYPSVSLDTVNRTLLTLNEIGAAFIVEGTGEVRRYDAGLHSHQHFKCLKCKSIIDFHYEPFDEIELPGEALANFKVLRKTVYFEGICSKCLSEEQN